MSKLEDSLPEEIKESIREAERLEREAKMVAAGAEGGEAGESGSGAKDKMIKAREKGRKFWQRFKTKSKALAANISAGSSKGGNVEIEGLSANSSSPSPTPPSPACGNSGHICTYPFCVAVVQVTMMANN